MMVKSYVEAVLNSDLLVVAGGGAITDIFKYHAMEMLTTFSMASKNGIPTAMLGQGIGPVQDADLRLS